MQSNITFYKMANYLKIIFLSVVFLTNTLYGQTADIVQGCVPLKVNFTAPATSSTYFWDFKDGVTSNLQNPANIFNKAGIYNVTFHESVGGPVIKTIKIEVFKEPILNIKVASGCYPLNAQIVSTSTIDPKITVQNYTWVFGDGITAQGATASSITHPYNTKGVYNISLGIETQYPSCNKTGIFNSAIEVFEPPVASFTTNPDNTVSCNSTLTVGFTNTSTGVQPLTYQWNLGNGQTSTAVNPPTQTYTKNSYNASLTVKFASNLTGCSATASKGISVGRPIPTIRTAKDTTCIIDTVVFTTATAGIRLWTVDANSTIVGANNRDSLRVVFSKSGAHLVSLQITTPDGACSDKISRSIYIDEVLASIQHTPQYSCSSPMTVQYKAIANQSNVQYKWTFNDSTKSTNQSVSHTYKTVHSDYYGINDIEVQATFLQVTSKKTGCKAITWSLDTMWLPNARLMPDVTKGCAPLNVQFSDSSKSNDPIVKWKWLYGDATDQTTSTKQAVSHTFTQPGVYSNRLIVTTKKGCIDTSYAVAIEVGTTIAGLDFTASKTDVCPGEAVSFTPVLPSGALASIDAYHFSTEGNRSFHCSNQKDLTWSYKYLTGPQKVTLTVDYNGCFTQVTKNNYVNVKGTIAKIDYSAACSDPLKYHFTDVNKNATSLSWDFGDNKSGTALNEVHDYASRGDYKVILTALDAASGCAATKDTVIVKPRSLQAKMTIDTLLCMNGTYTFRSNKSVDVDAQCYKGYDWRIPSSDVRQLVTSSTYATFKFTKAGVFTTQLIVSDVNGCKDTTTQKIKVFDIKPAFTADDKLICNPGIVHFTDQSVGDTTVVAWEWNFGDHIGGNTQNPAHTYFAKPDSNSTYTVRLVASDILGCRDTAYVLVQQYEPTSSIVITKPLLCLGETAKITATDYTQGGSNLKYSWDFGNTTTSTQQANNVLYASDAIYTVLLNFEEISSGCKGTTAASVSVQTYPTAAFTTSADTVVVLCAPKVVSFKDNSVSKYAFNSQWNFGNGEVSFQPSYTLVYPKGNYKVQHIVSTANGCADTTYKSFKVFQPEGNFVADKNAICKSESIHFEIKDTADVVSYAWAFGDGVVVENTAPVDHTYNFHPPSGSTLAKLSLVGSEGCNYQVQSPITIYQVISEFDRLDGVDSASCFNDGPYTLTNKSTGASSYYWDFGDGQTSTLQNVNSHAYASAGEYDVTLAVKSQQLGCADTIVKKIIIYENPVIHAIGDTVCQTAGSVSLSVTNPNPTSTYSWTPGTGLSSVTSTSPVATINHSVHYQVVETDKNGCTDKTDVPAIVIESINLRNLDTSIVIGDAIVLPVVGESYYKFLWTPTTGLSCLQCNYPKVQPLEDIRYNLNVTDVRGCYNENYFYNIVIKPETFVKLPSMFTPNGDGNNDVVYVNGWGIKNLLAFEIFNRWGQLIYTSNNITEGWDGTFNGAVQSSDIYVYKVKALTWRNVEIEEEGYINLVR